MCDWRKKIFLLKYWKLWDIKKVLLDRKNTREWIYFGKFNQWKRRFCFEIFRKLEINSNDCVEKIEDFCEEEIIVFTLNLYFDEQWTWTSARNYRKRDSRVLEILLKNNGKIWNKWNKVIKIVM